MPEFCVAHLVRKQNGAEPFRRYLDSYRRHPAGLEHDHLIVFKGFDGGADLDEYRQLLHGAEHHECLVDDTGFDIGSYLTAARRHPSRYYCFVNSYSRVLWPGWLGLLARAATADGVGLAGASGSAGSTNSYVHELVGLPNAYSGYLIRDPTPALPGAVPTPPPPGVWAQTFRRVRGAAGRVKRFVWPPAARALREKFEQARRQWQLEQVAEPARDYAAFSNYHIRTNAFVVSGEVLAGLPPVTLRDKQDAYRFESGRQGLTSHVLGLGLGVRVVGRDGRAYEPDQWHTSNTFWQADQENLLVADNQTDKYADGDDTMRLFLSRFAWREHAAPTPCPGDGGGLRVAIAAARRAGTTPPPSWGAVAPPPTKGRP